MTEARIKVYKTRPTAKLPARAHKTDAGIDFFFCPSKRSPITIPPASGAILETGIKMEVPPGYMLQIMNKSSIASKKQLIAGACVIDEGYNGEIFVNLQNIGLNLQRITPDQKIAQGVFIKIAKPSLCLIEEDNVYGNPTQRGTGALGSTGS